jgi:hypothetical protein
MIDTARVGSGSPRSSLTRRRAFRSSSTVSMETIAMPSAAITGASRPGDDPLLARCFERQGDDLLRDGQRLI